MLIAEPETGREHLVMAAAPVLEELVVRFGGTAHLSVLDGADVMTILSQVSPSASRVSDWSERRVPAYCTSSGRVLLFDHDRHALDALFPGKELPPRGRGAPRDVGELHRRIVAAKVRGYSVVDQELERGLVGVAAPVRDFRRRIVAALNVSGPKYRAGTQLEHTAGPGVEAAAASLSRQLSRATDRAPRAGRDGG